MNSPLFPDNAFPQPRNETCFCGSGERFKHCCGSQAADRKVPHGINIVENFLSPEECLEFRALADARDGRRFSIIDATGKETDDMQRVTEWVNFREDGQELLDGLIARAFTDVIIPHAGHSIDFYEEPQVLRYTAGGYYMHHSDAYLLIPEAAAWRKVVDRDISVLLYLNEDYEGGGLEFKRFNYNLQPKAGMLVWFPSDVRYEHMAKPVSSGTRYVMVSWASASGVEKVQNKRARNAIDWQTREKQST